MLFYIGFLGDSDEVFFLAKSRSSFLKKTGFVEEGLYTVCSLI